MTLWPRKSFQMHSITFLIDLLCPTGKFVWMWNMATESFGNDNIFLSSSGALNFNFNIPRSNEKWTSSARHKFTCTWGKHSSSSLTTFPSSSSHSPLIVIVEGRGIELKYPWSHLLLRASPSIPSRQQHLQRFYEILQEVKKEISGDCWYFNLIKSIT